jgi:hypothetical protein
VPVAEAGEVAVGAALAGVLGGGLAVHLQHPAARPAQPAPQQVQVVDLAGGRGGLVGLVDALEDGGQQPLGPALDPPGGEQLVLEGVEQGQAGAAAHGQVQVGLAGGRGRPRVDHHQGR